MFPTNFGAVGCKSNGPMGQIATSGISLRFISLWNSYEFGQVSLASKWGDFYIFPIFGLSYIYEKPILGDKPKPHKILLKSVVLFTEKHCVFQRFSLKSTVLFMELCFSALFTEKHCAFHGVVLFIAKHCAFHGVALFTEKYYAFHETALFTEKHCTFHWKALHFSWNCAFHWKALHFSWNCAYHWKALHFPLKSKKNSWFHTDL